MTNKWSILLAPRSHGKSTFMVCLLVYIICHNPQIRILVASDKEDLAQQFSRDVQITIEWVEEEFPGDFPFLRDKPWKLSEWYLRARGGKKQRHPTLATSAGRASVTGRRFDILVFDDILQTENVRNEAMRKKLEEWIRKEVLPTQDRSSHEKRLIIGTRKHPDDWYGKLLLNPNYNLMIEELYTEINGEREYLWPFDPETETGWNDEVLAMVRSDYRDNIAEFYQEYFNQPAPPHGLHFQLDWITKRYYQDLPPDNRLTYHMGVDPSMGKRSKNASSLAIAVVAYDYIEQKCYVVDMWKGKLPLTSQWDKVAEIYDKWNPEAVNVENALVNETLGNSIIERFEDRGNRNIYPVNHREHRLSGTNEIHKEIRIENIFGEHVKRGNIRFRDPELSPIVKHFLDYEYLPFPHGEMDLLDALNMAVDLVSFRSVVDEQYFYTV